MYKLVVSAVLSLAIVTITAEAQSNLTAKVTNVAANSPTSNTETDRGRDGFTGPVRRVRTEVAKLSNAAGKVEEGKKAVLETAEYDVNGVKTQNQYFPVSNSSLTGREVYKYDDKGNISEMTLVNKDGSLLSREVYRYDFDSVGNWVKMTTSVLVIENGKIEFEPTEVTYRTIFYYLDSSTAKLIQPDGSALVETRSSLPPQISLDKLKTSSVQPLPTMAASFNTAKPVVVVNSADAAPALRRVPVSGGVLNGKALNLPAPIYPDIARRMNVYGKVEVEVLVDEDGRVASARALSGPIALRDVATQAARNARFSPTKLSGQAVKITGTIEYNFKLP
ncbi:MAG TPA: energy transducer TonB [Pyrinomonadaceae bacterium]|nr:energy transducer TonB [Pyrinomonadaceae bacterium]